MNTELPVTIVKRASDILAAAGRGLALLSRGTASSPLHYLAKLAEWPCHTIRTHRTAFATRGPMACGPTINARSADGPSWGFWHLLSPSTLFSNCRTGMLMVQSMDKHRRQRRPHPAPVMQPPRARNRRSIVRQYVAVISSLKPEPGGARTRRDTAFSGADGWERSRRPPE
jgi:hypothetical protein